MGRHDDEARFMREALTGHPPFSAPWHVESWEVDRGYPVFAVRAKCGRMVVQPGGSREFCEAVVRSRNEGTVEEDVAFVQAKWQACLELAHRETERVREHFRAELDKVMETNRRLQDAIVAARKSGRVDGLPGWCQPGDEGETAGPDEVARLKPTPSRSVARRIAVQNDEPLPMFDTEPRP